MWMKQTTDYFLTGARIVRIPGKRHLIIQLFWNKVGLIPSSVHQLWNLQTIILRVLMPGKSAYDSSTEDYTLVVPAPFQIWKMPHLRHVEVNELKLPDPPSGHTEGQDGFILENLQTLATIKNFNCGEEVVKRVPNIKELRVCLLFRVGCSSFRLALLQKLESLTLDWTIFPSKQADVLKWKNLITFPRSLKKLSLTGLLLDWDDMMTIIGSLPLLELLKLHVWSVHGQGGFEWETVDGQFQSLKYLRIQQCGIEYWRTESTHFPRLVLKHLNGLKEIPSEIGDIPTLKSIVLEHCTNSAVISAYRVVKEQEELGNVDLHVRARLLWKNEEIQRLSSHNFIVSCLSDD